jgi:hypothetical protein
LLFEREKEIAAQLIHPNIVRSEAAGVWNDIHFIEMAATIIHMLTDQYIRPMGGRDPFKCVLEGRPRSLKDYLPGCPKKLNKVIERALAQNPKDRYENGRKVLVTIKKAL